MENYKKEKSSKQHLKIDLGQNQDQTEDDIFMLANPMTYGDVTTPTSPQNYSHGRIVSNPNTPTNQQPQGGFARSAERGSLKSKSKHQPSKFNKLFGRSFSGGNSATVNKDDEDVGDGSSGSDEHEDPFSPSVGDVMHSSRHMSEPPKSPISGNTDQHVRRHHSGGHSSRDSGFSSERESVTHLKEDSINIQQCIGDDVRVSPSDLDDYQPAGMEALEILHNQLQLLVKCDTDEDTDSVSVYEQVIANLSKQLEDQSLSLDTLRESEANLRVSLEVAEQRAMEAESKCALAEKRCASMSYKYKCMKRKLAEWDQQRMPKSQKRHFGSSHSSHRNASYQQSVKSHSHSPESSHVHSHSPDPFYMRVPSDSCRIPPQRVQSQTLYDRQMSRTDINGTPTKRPSTAQGFNEDIITSSISSLSHTETSV